MNIKLLKFQKSFKLFTDVKFAIIVLAMIALFSSFGSFIEQNESISFYKENYPEKIYGFIDSEFIIKLGLDHIYTTWWFLLLLLILATCLLTCTLTRQFPLFVHSKEYFFKKKETSFIELPFSVKIKSFYYLQELINIKIQNQHFSIYQHGNMLYGYKGLIGKLSPILVHLSLLIILLGSCLGAFQNFQAQEILPKGELFHIQNTIGIGWSTSLPSLPTRVNEFWVEYQNGRIHQFYSNLSLLDPYGKEIKSQTISVNNPLRYQNIDFYQSDWNVIGIRVKDKETKEITQLPVFPLQNNSKSWITWIPPKNQIILLDQFQNTFGCYDSSGNFLGKKSIGDPINEEQILIDFIPTTGLLIKYYPSIGIIYFGFGLLMITTCFSYFPYTQIWIVQKEKTSWIGSKTNRGKIQVEIEFENLIRNTEKNLKKLIRLNK